jgi:diaminopimelate decarboxylase
MTVLNYKDGKLCLENVRLEDIAAKAGTPVYCYSTEQVADNYHALQSALAKVMPPEKFTLCYACKANSNQAILKLLNRLGAGADVVSGGELYRAFVAGMTAKKIVFSGVGKNEVELTKAIKNSILQINVESESELNLISRIAAREQKIANIAFRVNPDVDAKTHAHLTTGLKENKFGIAIEQAPALYKHAKAMAGISAQGVAVHIGSQLTDLEPYAIAFQRVAELVLLLRSEGHVITRVDVGGGLGITYKDEIPPNLDDYAALIRDILLPLDVHVILEPGRSIVGNAGILLSRVLHIKNQFLIIDAAMNDLIRPAMYDAYHPVISCAEPRAGQATMRYDVVGPVCETGDTFLTDEEMPVMKAGDLVAILVGGAYGAVMSSTYNTRPLAPEVLVSDTEFDLVRKVQTVEEIVALDVIPDWLK